MNKFDGLDIVLANDNPTCVNTAEEVEQPALIEKQIVVSEENSKPQKTAKKSLFGVFATLAFCGVVAAVSAFNVAPIKTFLQTEYDYSKKDIIDVSAIFTSVAPTSLTIKQPFVGSSAESAGELFLTPYDMCAVKAGVTGVITEVSQAADNRSVSIKLQNGCVVKYASLAYVGVKEGVAVNENSPIGSAENSVTISAYLNEIRLPLAMGENGDIIWQN